MTSLEQDYQQFVQNMKKKIGIDLTYYKEAQMKRRLTSLREKRGFATFKDFFQAIEKDEKLYTELLDRITINVSEFFRNQNRWKVLEEKVIPLLPGTNHKKIKCWSSACSTGEEPYTLSIILQQSFPTVRADIVASDIDEGALKKAKKGIYSDRSMKEVPQNILKKYFKLENQLYYLVPEIKKQVSFRKIDLLVDDFDGDYDLIICRNVMIYFTEEAKHLLYNKFSKALKPGGVLFVGSTEQIFNPKQYQLETLDNFFYRKIVDA